LTQAEYSTARTLALKPFAARAALAAGIDFPTTSGIVAVLGRGVLVGVVVGVGVGLADVLDSGVRRAVGARMCRSKR